MNAYVCIDDVKAQGDIVLSVDQSSEIFVMPLPLNHTTWNRGTKAFCLLSIDPSFVIRLKGTLLSSIYKMLVTEYQVSGLVVTQDPCFQFIYNIDKNPRMYYLDNDSDMCACRSNFGHFLCCSCFVFVSEITHDIAVLC